MNVENILTVEDLWETIMQSSAFQTLFTKDPLEILPRSYQQMIASIDTMSPLEIIKAANKIRTLSNLRARYRINHSVSAPTTFVAAKESVLMTKNIEKYFENISIVELEGDHFSIMKNQQAAEIAQLLKSPKVKECKLKSS